ncbi:ATP-binding cassette domain-containing protein [Loigolactobacillus bifermentans]|uniref:ABC transporter ATP-binding protein/permease n=1 Tax=Loigolactobacillus bifermentans TaxID=1607 RepID=UPI00070B43A5|nr:ABC transporter ATP-binding protein/permease [Loigolactobacillus bifermentans]QGG61241.1 ATP-binding cassette domain-containing protein [Loigolactobacillus bifermentans]
MSYLELRDIHKSYYLGKEEFPVLKGIDLDFDLGDFVSILGESGGGKSTLMNIIGGLDCQFQGSVTVDGQRLDHHDEKAMDTYRRDTIGYIYQSYNLISHLSVLDNVLIPLDMTTLNKTKRIQRAKELLARVGLTEQARKYPNQLSGGQKQRVAIARALASDPKIIIADEPTGALDSQNTQEVLQILDEIAKDGRLVITVTHSQAVADAGSRIVHLADGQIDHNQRLHDPYPVSDKPRIQSKLLPASVSYKVAAKHFKYNFWRNFLIVIGTAIGLFAVMLFSGLGNGISGYINKQVTDMVNPQVVSVSRYQKPAQTSAGGGKQGGADQQAQQPQQAATTQASTTGTTSQPKVTSAQISRLKNVKHITAVDKVYSASTVTAKKGSKAVTMTNLANWNASATTNTIKKGNKPGKGEIVVDRDSVAKKLAGNNWQSLIGKTITLNYQTQNKAGKKVTVKLTAKVSGITATSNSMGMANDNYVNTATLTSAMKAANVSTAATSVAVNIDHLDNVKSVTKKINKLETSSKRQFSATSISSMISTIQTYVSLATNVLAAIAAISLVVSALMIIVTMYMSVSARTKEIGILRALGESKRNVRQLFISESLIIGVLSAVLATVLAFVGEFIANSLLSNIANFAFVQISLGNVITVFIVALIIALLAALLPARSAAKLNPIDALAAE